MIEIKDNINPKQYFPDAKHIIIYAFSIGDKHYFRFDDPLNNGYNRMLQTMVYYRHLSMNCDDDFLRAHILAKKNLRAKMPFTMENVYEMYVLDDQLEQRLHTPPEPELMYKFASVVFFDQHENPEVYEFSYGERKIAFWKEETDLEAFFLQTPVRQLIPYLQSVGENLKFYSTMADRLKEEHLEKIYTILSPQQKATLLSKKK